MKSCFGPPVRIDLLKLLTINEKSSQWLLFSYSNTVLIYLTQCYPFEFGNLQVFVYALQVIGY